MKVNTSNLKKMLSHVGKCKPSALLEISNYYEVKAKDNKLQIRATDGANFIDVVTEVKSSEEIDVIVKSDQLTKLINKTTKEEVDLIPSDSCLVVKGNGEYRVEIVEDETFPVVTSTPTTSFKINSNDIKNALNICKNAKSQTVADGVLYSYLIRGTSMVSADAIKVCKVNIKGDGLEDVCILITPALATLLTTLDKETVTVEIDEEKQLATFLGDTVKVVGPLAEGAETYPQLDGLLSEAYPSYCELDTQELLQALDRLNLFLGIYDKGLINVAFVNNSVSISTSTKSIETLTSKVDGHTDDILYTINGKYLQDLVSTVNLPTVTIEYGLPDTIKITGDGVEQLLAVSDEEE